MLWLTNLGDVEPAVRSVARENLMGLSPADLPLLRRAVAGTPRLTPAQAGPLEGIVTYVYARGTLLDQQPDAGKPFLGINLPYNSAEQLEDDDEQAVEIGVPVPNRLFGYAAYRFLQDGDVITAIGASFVTAGGRAAGGVPAGSLQPTHSRDELLAAIAKFSAGQSVTLNVLRGNRMIRVAIPLDARPSSATEGVTPTQSQLESNIERVREDADAYFDQQFRPLIERQA